MVSICVQHRHTGQQRLKQAGPRVPFGFICIFYSEKQGWEAQVELILALSLID